MILRDVKAYDREFTDATQFYAIGVGAAATITRSIAVGSQLLPLIACFTTGSVVTLSVSGIVGGAFVSQSFTVSPSLAGSLGAFVPPGANPPWWQEWQGFVFDVNTVVTITTTAPAAGVPVALLVLSAIR